MRKLRKVNVYDVFHPETGKSLGFGSKGWAEGFATPYCRDEEGNPLNVRIEVRTLRIAGPKDLGPRLDRFEAGEFQNDPGLHALLARTEVVSQ